MISEFSFIISLSDNQSFPSEVRATEESNMLCVSRDLTSSDLSVKKYTYAT